MFSLIQTPKERLTPYILTIFIEYIFILRERIEKLIIQHYI